MRRTRRRFTLRVASQTENLPEEYWRSTVMALPVDFWRHEQMLNIFRSKPCQRLSRDGACDWRSQCQFSHCPEWPRRPPQRHPYTADVCANVKTVCNEWGQMELTISCSEGGKCSKAHSKDEVLYHPHIFKTLPCEDYQARGGKSIVRRCHRFYCPFAHGDQELRESPLCLEDRQALVEAALEQFPSNDCCKVCAPDLLVPHYGEVVDKDALDDPKAASKRSEATNMEAFLGGMSQTVPSLVQAVCSGCAPSNGGLHAIQAGMPVMVHYVPMSPTGADGAVMHGTQSSAGDCSNSLDSATKQGMQVISSPGVTMSQCLEACGIEQAGYPAMQDDSYSMSMAWQQASFMTPCMTMHPFLGQLYSQMPVADGKSAAGEYDYSQYDTSTGTFLPAIPPFPVAAHSCQAGYASHGLDMTGMSVMHQNYCHWTSVGMPKASDNGWQDNDVDANGYSYHGAGCASMTNGYQSVGGVDGGQVACNMESAWQRPPSQKWLLTAEELLKERDPPEVTITDLWCRLKEENLSIDFDEPGSPTLHRLKDELKAWPTYFAVEGDTVTLARRHQIPGETEVMQVMG
mmetsp:Transcript_25234/g.58082  ORF Transcript_25234/g.58082 Transcript_25234/m.58082 type:complete len:573 (+) Transcript_25234:91-1809(+)